MLSFFVLVAEWWKRVHFPGMDHEGDVTNISIVIYSNFLYQ